MTLVLADTTILSNFSQIQRPDLLRQAFPLASIPKAVRDELRRGESLGYVPVCDWSWLRLIELTEEEVLRADDLSRALQAGEAACLAVGELRGALVLTDDRAARRIAATLNVEISGTVGTLVRLVNRGLLDLSEGDRLLAEMTARGYRSPVRSLREPGL